MSFLKAAALWSLLLPLSLAAISTGAALLTPEPGPVRTGPVPENGEFVRAGDGAELFLRHWLPEQPPRAVILGLHGMGQHSGYHAPAGERLSSAGIAYYALDLRGNGLTRTRHGDIPSAEILYDDLALLVDTLERRHPGLPVYLLGHSLGAALAANWAAESHPRLSGLLILAPAMTAEAAPVPWTNWIKAPALWSLFPHRAVLKVPETAYARERLAEGINIPEEVDRIVQDPLKLQAMSMSFALGIQRFREKAIGLAPRIKLPTLVLVGDADQAADGAHRFYDSLTTPDKQFVSIPSAEHNLFQLREREAVIEAVLQWLQAKGR